MTDTQVPTVSRTRFWIIYVALCAGMFVSSLNHTILSAAMPTIVGELGGVQSQAWMTTAFLLTATVAMPVYGRLGDSFGRGGLYLTAVTIFTIGSVGAGFAPDFWALVAWRAVQGIGGGGLMVLSQAIIGQLLEPMQRAKFMAPLGVIFAVSAVLGPVVGGTIVDNLTWHWVFLVNVPVGVVSILVAIFAIRLPRPRVRPRVDIEGMITLSVLTVSLLVGIEQLSAHGVAPPSPLAAGCLIVALVSFVVFILVERRAVAPVMPLWLFRNRQFLLATVVGFILGVMLVAVLTFMPTLLQMGKGQSAMTAGLLVTPMNGGWIIVSLIVGAFVSRTGRYKTVTIAGGLVTTLSVLLVAFVTDSTPVWLISLLMLSLGVGLGMCFNLLIVIAQNAVSVNIIGTATGAHNYVREVGSALGVAVVGAWFTSSLHARLTDIYLETGLSHAQAAKAAGAMSPEVLAASSAALNSALSAAYIEALIPAFLWLVPALLVAVGLSFAFRGDAFTVPAGGAVGDDVVGEVAGIAPDDADANGQHRRPTVLQRGA